MDKHLLFNSVCLQLTLLFIYNEYYCLFKINIFISMNQDDVILHEGKRIEVIPAHKYFGG